MPRILWFGSLMLGYIFEVWALSLHRNIGGSELLGIIALAFIAIAFLILILEHEAVLIMMFVIGNFIMFWIFRPHLPPIQREYFGYLVAVAVTAVFVHQAQPGRPVNSLWMKLRDLHL